MSTRALARIMHRTVLVALAFGGPIAAVPAHVGLLAPNGGEVLQPGTTFTIRWEVRVGHNTQNWDLWYSVSGASGPWIPIVMDLPPGNIATGAQHSYRWTVPATPSTRVRIRVRQDNSGIDYYDISDADLTIATPAATYAAYGQGCAGSAGVPVLAARAGAAPVLGTTFGAELSNLPAASPGAFLVAGLAPTPAMPLGGFGLPGCQSYVTFDATSFVPVAAGIGLWSASIPNRSSLIGAEFFHQAVVLDPAAPNPAGAAITNAARALISDH